MPNEEAAENINSFFSAVMYLCAVTDDNGVGQMARKGVGEGNYTIIIVAICNYHKYFCGLYCRDMVHAANHRSVAGETVVRSQISPCEVM